MVPVCAGAYGPATVNANDLYQQADDVGLLVYTDISNWGKPLTRLEACELIVALVRHKLESPASDFPYTDCDSLTDNQRAVVYTAAKHGLCGGTGGNRFSPDSSLSQAQIASMLHRAIGRPSTGGADSPFTDVLESAWYYDSILCLYDLGIIPVSPSGLFYPNEEANGTDVLVWLIATSKYLQENDDRFQTPELLFPISAVVPAGGSLALKAAVVPKCEGTSYEFFSDNENVAQVIGAGNSVTVTGISAGTANITVKSGIYTATCTVVVPGLPTSISLPAKFNILGGDWIELIPKRYPDNSVLPNYMISSTDQTVVEAKTDGTSIWIRGIQPGTVTIRVSISDDVYAESEVTVRQTADSLFPESDNVGLFVYSSVKDWDEPLTRLEACELIVALARHKLESPALDFPYTDCDSLTDNQRAVVYTAAKYGLCGGVAEDRFSPDSSMTRAQIAAMLCRTIGGSSTGGVDSPFTDVLESAWYYDSILCLYDLGIIPASPSGLFYPNEEANGTDALDWMIATSKYLQENDDCFQTPELLFPISAVVPAGGSLALKAAVVPEPDGTSYTFTSKNGDIAQVSSDGGHSVSVTGISQGTASVTVEAEGMYAVCQIIVAGHIHNWSEGWIKTPTHHWHTCTVDGCDIDVESGKGGYGPHVYATGSDTICDICGYIRTVYTDDSSSGAASSKPEHAVTVSEWDHGSVDVTPKRADKGDTVTITVKPDKGYELDELTVTDKGGNTIKIKDKGDGKFTFTMPGSKVTVEASFKQIDAEPEVPAFADVPADAYYADAVAWAVKEGITSGTSATTFTPNASCTRAQMVTFLWRANGSPVVNYAMSFTDVPADAYYAEAVRWAVSEGITTGTTATTFSPNATLTRAQAVTFIYRNVQAQGGGFTGSWMFPCPFTDVPADAYYFESVQWCAMKNITSGTSATTFSPDATCTRVQIVTFMYRAD